MERMFYYASKFDQNIGAWNTAKVTDSLLDFFLSTDLYQHNQLPHRTPYNPCFVTQIYCIFTQFDIQGSRHLMGYSMTDPSTTRLENTSDDFTGQTNTHIPESFGSSRELWVPEFLCVSLLGL